jgi:hypothetical protein
MQVELSIPPYDRTSGLSYEWDEGFEIAVRVEAGEVVISANQAGLTSLARHLLTLAQTAAPDGSHLHLTAGQEIDSPLDLILERVTER